MAQINDRFEFSLTIKRYGIKPRQGMYDPYPDKDSKEEVLEELSFKSLSVVEVIRKCLDYVNNW